MDELVAWLLFPLAVVVICTGIGLLAERLAGVRLEAALVPALGYPAAIVVLGPLFAVGADELAALLLLVALAAAGFAVAFERWRRPGWGALSGLAAYALHIAPVALSGSATFLGYNLLNDTAIHLALVDWIADHGTRYEPLPPSSYAAAIRDYVGTSYPLGSHELLAALRPVSGLDPALIYQPFLALSAGVGAAAVFALLRSARVRPPAAALAGFCALAGQLVFSFSLQGGIKEIGFITCLVATAALAAGLERAERPAATAGLAAVPAAALYAIYGVYAMPWIGVLALLALVLLVRGRKPLARASLAGGGVFLAATAVVLKGSVGYYRHGHDVITAGTELGPLAGPLNVLQVSGIWLNGDYRFAPTTAPGLTYLLAGAVVIAAVAGLVVAVRRRVAGPLLLALPALVALFVVAPVSSPYIDAKLLVVAAPAVVVAACLALAAMPRVAWLPLAVVLGGALLVSDGLAYRMAMLAPMDRLEELARIDERFAGQGPVLVNEYEEYTKHFMRRSRGSDPYEGWNVGRAQLLDPSLPVGRHAYDLDQLVPEFVQQYPLIATRRSPAASRPPSNYDRAFRGRWYEVWKRVRPAPVRHVPLGEPPLQASARPSCVEIGKLAALGPLAAAVRPEATIIDITPPQLPPGWYRDGSDKTMLDIRKGGAITVGAPAGEVEGLTTSNGRVEIWLRGRTFRTGILSIGEQRVTVPRASNGPNQWIEVGTQTLASEAIGPITLERSKRSLRPGDAQADHIGPIALIADVDPAVVRVKPSDYRDLCGRPLDWVDVRQSE